MVGADIVVATGLAYNHSFYVVVLMKLATCSKFLLIISGVAKAGPTWALPRASTYLAWGSKTEEII